ncbi:MAG: ABC transporter ATP-binding protein [Clostridiales bacterium]|nr:ABC transporter ATP-binding protein [Clostridiales bacterium]
MHTYRHILDFLKEKKYKYLLGIIVLIIVDALQLITPQILKAFTNAIIGSTLNAENLWIYPTMILVVAIGIAASRYLWRILIITSSRELEFWLRNKLFKHIESLDQSFFNKNKTGDLMAHATNDLSAVKMAFGPGIVMVVDAIFLSIMTIIIMATNLNLKLTLLALLPMPIIAITVGFFGKIIQQRFKSVQESFSNLSEKVQESFSGIRVIKSFSQEKYDLDDFNTYNMANLKSNMKLVKLFGAMHPLITLISTISLLIILTYGSKLVINQTMTLGDFVAFISYIEILTWPMMAIGFVVNVLQRGMASMKRINVLLDSKSNIEDYADENIENIDIEFRNLTFKYPDTNIDILNNINLTIPTGSSLGILGRTGSGKTTIINLLTRLYQVEKNMIFIGNKDFLSYSTKDIRNLFGVVPQDNFLFSTSIESNIAFSTDTIDDKEKIQYTANISQIDTEIQSFPDGFETILGERGINLSGGQKQRVSIARALYKQPQILVLDDSLSAVDTDTEERILKHLKTQLSSRTAIVISHRISTLKNLDAIAVLDEGKIIEYGTHNELIKSDGLYYDIYKKQLIEEALQEEE